ncbi:phosphatase PAP2 family protein [Kribbella sp. NPDC051586]|uniref:phosphatase PAP2 family protein n=1 Tax=Kribbella sp. NPDC051586 TaxID=3364118 RepID=UPI0037921AB5
MTQMTLDRAGQPALPELGRHRSGGIWRIVREVALLAALFGVYNLGRFLSAEHSGSAFKHAHELIRWEAWLGLPSEATLQHHALQVDGLARAANAFYATVHFPLTAMVLLWLMIRRPAEYRKARWALASLTGLALIGHMFFPLAPPRMMPGWVDTGVRLGQSVYGPSTHSGIANQFAAMPSLHVGWALMVAVFLIRATRSRWRWLWIAHPLLTFGVVVVTANHYWLDGLAAMALAAPLLLIFDSSSPARTRKGSRSSTSRAAAAPMSNQSPISSSRP